MGSISIGACGPTALCTPRAASGEARAPPRAPRISGPPARVPGTSKGSPDRRRTLPSALSSPLSPADRIKSTTPPPGGIAAEREPIVWGRVLVANQQRSWTLNRFGYGYAAFNSRLRVRCLLRPDRRFHRKHNHQRPDHTKGQGYAHKQEPRIAQLTSEPQPHAILSAINTTRPSSRVRHPPYADRIILGSEQHSVNECPAGRQGFGGSMSGDVCGGIAHGRSGRAGLFCC